MADLGWPNSWRKNCPPSDFLPKNIKLDGIGVMNVINVMKGVTLNGFTKRKI